MPVEPAQQVIEDTPFEDGINVKDSTPQQEAQTIADELSTADPIEPGSDSIDGALDTEDYIPAGLRQPPGEDKPDVVPGKVGATSTETAQSEEQAASWDPAHLSAAGFTQEQAEAYFASPQALETYVTDQTNRLIIAGQQRLQQQQSYHPQGGPSSHFQQQPQWQQQPQPPQGYQVQPPSDANAAQQGEFQLPEQVLENLDEDVVAALRSVYSQTNAQLAAQRQMIESQQQYIQQMQAHNEESVRQNYIREVDTFINSLDDGWSGLLGVGKSSYELEPSSFAIQNRIRLDQMANMLAAGYQAEGRPVPDRATLLASALPSAFPGHFQKAVEARVTNQVANRQSQFTQRPTQRVHHQSTNREEQAAKNVENWFRQRGYSVEEDDFDYSSF